MSEYKRLLHWIEECAELTEAAEVRWCDGTEDEYRDLVRLMLEDGTLLPLSSDWPNCYLHRSDPKDVARVEHLTFICTPTEEEAGPNNNWMDPQEAKAKMRALFKGAMAGRTLYVAPYCLGPLGAKLSRYGVTLTDSPYVVANLHKMTRTGTGVKAAIEGGRPCVRGLHAMADLDPDRRFIMHFPEENLIESVGSGYGGNALLPKKCHALRLASVQARREGWLAEHMLIVGIESPDGQTDYIAAAFPSACGKTNLAMLRPPAGYEGWKIWTVGDDIAWMHEGEDGRLWAINPERGFFGVIPGTNSKSNPSAFESIQEDTIYTNAAVTADNSPWWEGLEEGEPALDWQGRPYGPDAGRPAAHPNSRFTVSIDRCPTCSPKFDDPRGVPISAIVFGGRRSSLVPLVREAEDWGQGVLIGASMASETTAAAAGEVGVTRRDPMAMKPFLGYNFGDYWQHWFELGSKLPHPPRVFGVNWFRRGQDGRFLWPGFSENIRVLEWILARCRGRAEAEQTPIGLVPQAGALNSAGLDDQDFAELMAIDVAGWRNEISEVGQYFRQFAAQLPPQIEQERQRVLSRLGG